MYLSFSASQFEKCWRWNWICKRMSGRQLSLGICEPYLRDHGCARVPMIQNSWSVRSLFSCSNWAHLRPGAFVIYYIICPSCGYRHVEAEYHSIGSLAGCFGLSRSVIQTSHTSLYPLRPPMSASYAINMPPVAVQTAPSRTYRLSHCLSVVSDLPATDQLRTSTLSFYLHIMRGRTFL